MAGVARHPKRSASRALSLLIAAAMLALLLLGASSSSPTTAQAARASQGCPPLPVGLSPPGPGPTRFTMMIRINTQLNVDTWTNYDETTGGLGDRIRPQDIFVVNTRFTGSANFPPNTPTQSNTLANELRTAFPCNRIIALNGMSFTSTSPGYAFSLIDNPSVYALITDYEKTDWDAGRASDPARPAWVDKFQRAFPIIKGWNASVAATAAANPVGAGKRTGLAPMEEPTWNYGQIAQHLDKQNARLGGTRLAPLSVQTQDTCADGGASTFGPRAKQLRLQYTFKFITKKVKVPGKKKKRKVTIRQKLKKQGKPLMSNLAMEISFSANPDSSDSMALVRTSAATAAACVPPGLKQGGGAFLFFAADDAMRLLFQQPQIAALRPPVAAGGASGGVGAP